VLTGAFGEGELGPDRQPRHPHGLALARLLLEAGADPNDGQALYNRMFQPANDHLELLFEYGLGTADGGPWRARLGVAVDTPTEMLRGQLSWAIEHGFTERVQLLIDHGTDLATPFRSGRTPVEAADASGHPAIAALLVSAGSPVPRLTPTDALIAAALAVDRAGIDRILGRHPDAAVEAIRRRPGVMVWAAANGWLEAVRLLVELGFDINAKGRGDTPIEQEWSTALHEAAGNGNAELVQALLDLGADRTIEDRRFDSTPEQWARYFGHESVAELVSRAR
jgi:ankyrin repeat protein